MDGRELQELPGQPVRAALLIYLAAERLVAREAVTLLLWPDAGAEAARRSLRQTLYTIRRDLHPSVIESTGQRLRAGAALQSDAADFDAAVSAGEIDAALGLYRGPFLPDGEPATTREFEAWADMRRAAAARTFRRLCRQRIDDAAAGGDLHSALAAAMRWVDLEPHEDEAQHRLIQVLAGLGLRTEALAQYESHARALAAEGLRPLEETVALISKVRDERSGGLADARVRERLPLVVPPNGAAAPGGIRGASVVLRRRVRLTTLLLSTILLLTLGFLLSRSDLLRPQHDSDAVAVVPFENVAADPSLDLTAQILTELVSQGLSTSGIAPVVELGESAVRQGSLTAAREVRAGMVVRGAVYREENTVMIQVRLLDRRGKVVTALQPIRSEGLDPRTLGEPVREAVLGAVAALRAPGFTAWRDGVSRPPRYDALLAFLAGMEAIARLDDHRALEHLHDAARLDSGFLQARVLLLDALPGHVAVDSVLAYALKLRAHATPFDRLALDRLVHVHRGEFDWAYHSSRRLLRLAPWSVEARYWLARDAMRTNRFRVAVQALDRVDGDFGWLDGGPLLEQLRLMAMHAAGHFDDELATARQTRSARGQAGYHVCARELRPLAARGREGDADRRLYECLRQPDAVPEAEAWMDLAAEYGWHGHRAAELRALARAEAWLVRQEPSPRWMRLLARVEFQTGRWSALAERERQIIGRGNALTRDHMRLAVAMAHLGDSATAAQIGRALSDAPIEQAVVAAALGDTDRAIAFLRKGVERGMRPAVEFHAQPGLAPLRGVAAFEALLQPRN